jgi:LacI family transcriptional regulator
MSRVTIYDIAEEAGVSAASASRILSGCSKYSFSAETQERVRAAAERMGYRANAAARLLKQKKKTLVGLAMQLSVHPYLNRLTIAVRDELVRQGYDPILVEPEQLVSSSNQMPFPSLEMLAGVLSLDLSIGQSGSEAFENLRRELPLVALYPIASKDVDWVCTDDARGTELAMEHLVGLGHRRIAFSEILQSSFHSDHLKVAGWRRALRKHRLAANETHFLEVGFHPDIEQRAEHIEAALLALRPAPTALICSGDESALCVMGRLQARSWKIPRDFSIVGYDGIAFGAYSHPQLTTIEQPVEEIARAGVLRLLEIVEQRHEEAIPKQKLIAPRLLVRGSTAKAAK